jgi:hypothetical protein
LNSLDNLGTSFSLELLHLASYLIQQLFKAMQLRHLVAGFLPQSPNPKPVHVIYVMDKVAFGLVSALYYFGLPVSIILPMLHTY